MKIVLDSPASFYTADRNVCVYDEKGNIFYVNPNRTNKLTFNLPVGTYSTNNNIKRLGFKAYVPFIHHFVDPEMKKFKVVTSPNPFKASIIPSKRKIIISDKIRYDDGTSLDFSEYKPCQTFLLVHEKAHRQVGSNIFKNGKLFFDAEKACDNIAENYMLSHGFNPSQIQICKQLLLTSKHRKCSQYNPEQMNFKR